MSLPKSSGRQQNPDEAVNCTIYMYSSIMSRLRDVAMELSYNSISASSKDNHTPHCIIHYDFSQLNEHVIKITSCLNWLHHHYTIDIVTSDVYVIVTDLTVMYVHTHVTEKRKRTHTTKLILKPEIVTRPVTVMVNSPSLSLHHVMSLLLLTDSLW